MDGDRKGHRGEQDGEGRVKESERGRGNNARGTFPLVSRQLVGLGKGAHREGGKKAEGGEKPRARAGRSVRWKPFFLPRLSRAGSHGECGCTGGRGGGGGLRRPRQDSLRVLDRELRTAPAQGPRGRAIFQGQVPALLANLCPHRLVALTLTRFPVCVCDVSRCSESLSSGRHRGSSDEKHWISKPQFSPVGMMLR